MPVLDCVPVASKVWAAVLPGADRRSRRWRPPSRTCRCVRGGRCG